MLVSPNPQFFQIFHLSAVLSQTALYRKLNNPHHVEATLHVLIRTTHYYIITHIHYSEVCQHVQIGLNYIYQF